MSRAEEREDREIKAFIESVGKRIREHRDRKGLTQEQLDTSPFPIPVRTLQNIEQSTIKDIKLSTLFRLARKLGVSPKDLLP